MKLPTEEQCLNYFDEFKVPFNIKNHCLRVRDVAVFLAERLQEKGVAVNVEFVHRIAILHDLFKVVVIDQLEPNEFYNVQYSEEEIKMWKKLREKYPNMHECDAAYLFFKDEFPELAQSLKDVSSHFKENKIIEEDLAYYADWRIFNDKIVSLSERLENLKKRYPAEESYWEGRARLIRKKEEQLFSLLNFFPKELDKSINIK